MTFSSPEGDVTMNFITAKGAGFTEFALIPHANGQGRPDATFAAGAKWAAELPLPVYAIDDETAIKVIGDSVEVVSEGEWKLY